MEQNLSKINIKVIALGVIFIVLILGVCEMLVYSDSDSAKLKKQIDLGRKYLNELNYEQAVTAFENALEIAPLNEDVNNELLDAYQEWARYEMESANMNMAFRVAKSALERYPGDLYFNNLYNALAVSGDEDYGSTHTTNNENVEVGTKELPQEDDAEIIEQLDWLMSNGLAALPEGSFPDNEAFEDILVSASWYDFPPGAMTEGVVFYSFEERKQLTDPTVEILEAYIDLLKGNEERFSDAKDTKWFERYMYETAMKPDYTSLHARYLNVFLSNGDNYRFVDSVCAYRMLSDAYLLRGEYEKCENIRKKVAKIFDDEKMLAPDYIYTCFDGYSFCADQYGRITQEKYENSTPCKINSYNTNFISMTENYNNEMVSVEIQFAENGVCQRFTYVTENFRYEEYYTREDGNRVRVDTFLNGQTSYYELGYMFGDHL